MFQNWIMLAGLGGAAVPLVLHLLARARYREVDWGAMMFLEGAQPQVVNSTRLKQWALLGVRMLLVSLIAMALARPVARGKWGGVATEGRITAVVLLDCSASMAVEEAGLSRFDKAKQAVLQVLSQLRKGDEVSIVLLGEQVSPMREEPTSNLQTVAREVGELQVSSGLADIAAGMAVARTILDRPTRANRELYLVCDRQAASWMGSDANPSLTEWLRRVSTPTRFYVVPVGGEESDSVVIESVELADSLAIRSQRAEVEVRLRNYSSAPRVGLDLSLSVLTAGDAPRRAGATGRRLRGMPVSIAAKSSATVRLPVVFDETGSHVLTAQIRTTGLREHRFDTAIDVIDPVNVLIVSGDEATLIPRRESFYLKLALSPHQSVQQRPGDPAKVTVATAEEWAGIDLNQYQVIILANVPRVAPEQARALEQRVYEGGGLIIAPGGMTRIDSYNDLLFKDGQGVMPARLGMATSADGAQATTLLGLNPDHPVFRFQRGEPPPEAIVGRYFPAETRSADAVEVGSYRNGARFVIEGPRGRGRRGSVLLVTTPLDADWSTLPLTGFYLPFVQSMVRYAGASALLPRNLEPGEPILVTFDEPLEEAEIRRHEQIVKPKFGPTAGGTQIRHADTQHPGIYRLAAKLKASSSQPRVLHFVVRPPKQEADPTPLSPEQWRHYEQALSFERLEPNKEAFARSLATDRGGRELWLPLVLVAVALGVCELWLARLWSRERD